ncbi:hypothetical protein [uncultured Boseongicola sp.]|jgi:hypothetical protein|uniref:hypothetical protein n=1 Tax=uncultured Boseongicola sp. TaxID=1648499 RepID=UPI002627CB30|nr:hypothetical protein [uncultured Boseongicola sp.]
MLRLLIPLVFAAAPSFAQDAPEPEGRDLMSEALRLFMRGLLEEMEPAINDLSALLDSLDAYHAPEVLPNGDIIIRRKTPLKPEENDTDEIEL